MNLRKFPFLGNSLFIPQVVIKRFWLKNNHSTQCIRIVTLPNVHIREITYESSIFTYTLFIEKPVSCGPVWAVQFFEFFMPKYLWDINQNGDLYFSLISEV